MIHLRQLGPAFLRHVEAYGQLAGAALRDTSGTLRSRAALAACGLVLAIAFVVLAGATAIAAGWVTPYRWWVAAAVLGSIACGAALCLARATAAMPRSAHLQALREEWRKDKDWLARGRGSQVAEPGAPITLQVVPRGTDANRAAGARAPTAS